MRALQISKALLYLTLSSCTVYVSLCIGRALSSVTGSAASFKTTLADIDLTAKGASGAIARANSMLDSQERAVSNTVAETSKSARQFRTLLDFTNRSLNEPRRGLLPSLSSLVVAVQAETETAATGINETLSGLDATNESLRKRINDPRINDLVTNSELSAANLREITTSTAETSSNIAAMTGDMRIKVHALSQPPSRFHNILDGTYTVLKFGSLFIP